MNLNYCTYKSKNNTSWIDVVDKTFDFNVDGDDFYSNTKCIINTNRLIDIKHNFDSDLPNLNVLYCKFTFIDGEIFERYISPNIFNKLKAIIRNNKLKQLINEQ